jgi:periplasmic divalent cation tolerance protein
VGPIWSAYWWKGQVQEAREWYCHLKTTAGAAAELSRRIRALHPYDVPEIIVVTIKEGDVNYLRWIDETVQPLPAVPAQ